MANPQPETLVPAWTLGDRLGKTLREARNGKISHQEMADHLKCSRNTIGNYINDHTAPSHAVLRSWALRTGWPLAWIETGELDLTGPSDPKGGGTLRNPTSAWVTGDSDNLFQLRTAPSDIQQAA